MTIASLLLLLFVWQALAVLMLLFAGVLFGIVLLWVKRYAHRYLKLPPPLALTLVVVSLLVAFGLLIAGLAPMLVGQIRQLAAELPRYVELVQQYLLQYEWAEVLLPEPVTADQFLRGLQQFDTDLVRRVVGLFSTTMGLVLSVALIGFIGIYIAAEPDLYVNGMLRLVPKPRRRRAMQVLRRMHDTILWWLAGQLVSMLFLGVLTGVSLALLGVPYALSLGLLTALMTFIPNLGPFLSYIPTMLVTLANVPGMALWVTLLYVVIQNIEGYFVTPVVQRRVIAMPPVVILILQIVLVTTVGFIGALLAMPLVACAMVLVRMVYVEDLLGDSFERPPL